jgi:hypothetical protein
MYTFYVFVTPRVDLPIPRNGIMKFNGENLTIESRIYNNSSILKPDLYHPLLPSLMIGFIKSDWIHSFSELKKSIFLCEDVSFFHYKPKGPTLSNEFSMDILHELIYTHSQILTMVEQALWIKLSQIHATTKGFSYENIRTFITVE